MASFKDLKGEVWEVPFTLREALKINSVRGIDLMMPVEKGDPMKEFAKIVQDLPVFLGVLHVCCERQCIDRDLSEEDFYGRLDFGLIEDVAAAFWEAFVNFSQRGQNKERVRLLMAKRSKAMETKIAIEREKVVVALESFVSASSSPASSASTQSHERSAN